MAETIKRFTYWEFNYCNFYTARRAQRAITSKSLCLFIFNNNNTTLINNPNLVIWKYTKNSVILRVTPQTTFTDLVSILNKTNLCRIKDVSSFAKIARGQRKKYHNWQLVAIDVSWDLI